MFSCKHKIFLTLLLYLLSISVSSADLVNGSVSPTSNSVAIGGPALVVLTWRVVLGPQTPSGAVTVTSPGGLFVGSDLQPLAPRNNKRLSQTVFVPPPANVPVNTPASFTEAVQIPQSVIYRAQTKGGSRFTYRREFTDSTSPNTPFAVSAVFDIGGSASGALNITRIALKFDDLSVARIGGREEKLYATAEISYTGTGLLSAVWEVAPVSSSSQSPVFFPLTTIRQYLSSGGLAVLQSPLLPTMNDGLYFVRLRVGRESIPTNQIQYQVQGYLSGEPSEPPKNLLISNPPAQSRLSADTEFEWVTVPGARAYQLELYRYAENIPGVSTSEIQTEQPVTGVLVPGSQEKVKLSVLTRNHLSFGVTYHWRVIAIGENGAVVAVSTARTIHVKQ